MNDPLYYTVTFADGDSNHNRQHYQRRNVGVSKLAGLIRVYQGRGQRIIRVEVQS